MVKNSSSNGFSTKLTWIFILCLKNFQRTGGLFQYTSRVSQHKKAQSLFIHDWAF